MLNINRNQGNAIQNHNEIPPHALAIIKKMVTINDTKITMLKLRYEEKRTLYTVGRGVNLLGKTGGSSKNSN